MKHTIGNYMCNPPEMLWYAKFDLGFMVGREGVACEFDYSMLASDVIGSYWFNSADVNCIFTRENTEWMNRSVCVHIG